MMWYDDGGHQWAWGGWLMVVSMVLFWGLLIGGAVLAARYFGGTRATGPGTGSTGSRAEDVLAERYARGEIDEDEYRRRVAFLREHHPITPGT